MKIFLIDPDNLRRNIFEEVFGEEVYTLRDMDDASFRIPDFAPHLILVSEELWHRSSEEVKNMILNTQIPLVLHGKEKGEWEGAFLEHPIRPEELSEIVGTLISQLKKS